MECLPQSQPTYAGIAQGRDGGQGRAPLWALCCCPLAAREIDGRGSLSRNFPGPRHTLDGVEQAAWGLVAAGMALASGARGTCMNREIVTNESDVRYWPRAALLAIKPVGKILACPSADAHDGVGTVSDEHPARLLNLFMSSRIDT
jgi:hypothetical protein